MRKGPTDIKRWEEDALADGWDIQKTRTCDVLTRDRFVVHVYDKEIAAWGPDGLCLETTSQVNGYNFPALKADLDLCFYCHQRGPTVRLGFAGRVCPKCRKEHLSEVEYRGWDN